MNSDPLHDASPPTAPRFRKLILRALLLPALLMLCLAGLLVWQIERLLGTSGDVQHSDLVIAEANHLLKIIIDMETGVRGYVVTGEREFLQPYDEALLVIDAEEQALIDLVSDNKPQQQTVQKIREIRKSWLAYAVNLIETRSKGGDAASIVKSRVGKRQMDAIRAQFSSFIAAEEQLRDLRSTKARWAANYILAVAALIALIGGAALAFLSWQQLKALSRNYAAALGEASDLNATLEERVASRTRELAEANHELEAFSYSVSHDLRAPMRHVTGFAELLRRSLADKLNPDESENLATIQETAKLAGRMVDDLLAFSRIGRTELRLADVDMTALVEQSRRELQFETAGRSVEWRIGPLPPAYADPALLRLVVQNLISNAVKYSARAPDAVIEIGTLPAEGGVAYFVRDNGVGFDPLYSSKLFGVFQRLHRAEEFEGTGIGLANVRRIILRHGGRVWAEGKLSEGATFYFFLPVAGRVQMQGNADDSDQAHPAR